MEHLLSTWGYAAIFLLTALESCCVPLPSEITVGYAGVLSAEGHLQIVLVIVIATLGELVGAFVAWGIGRSGGRVVVERFGRYVLLTRHDLDRAETWVDDRGEWGILLGRVVPLVRTFISLPAGITEMKPVKFGLCTAAGSLVWISTLAAIGYSLAGSWKAIAHDFEAAGYVLGVVVVLAVAALVFHRLRIMRSERARPGSQLAESRESQST